MIQPDLTVIGGPNGSGKTTLINYLVSRGVDFDRYINADDIARNRGLTGDAGALAARLAADRLREEYLSSRQSFSFETVMSHISKVEFMSRAKAAGYRVTLYFVATDDPKLNQLRVQTRVALGGHDVPKVRILARYHRSIANLPKALAVCDKTVVFDNSALGGEPGGLALRPILSANLVAADNLFVKLFPNDAAAGDMTVKLSPPIPVWALEALRVSQCGYELRHITDAEDGFAYLMFRPTTSTANFEATASDDRTVRMAIECLRQAELGNAPRYSFDKDS